MKLFFAEQDVIDAVCVYVAVKYRQQPEDVQAELLYEETTGFAANATVRNGLYRYSLTEQEVIDAIAVYLSDYHQFDPKRLAIELQFQQSDGFTANIEQLTV